MTLSKSKSKLIGNGFLFDVYHPSLSSLFPDAPPGSYFEDEKEQSYAEFIRMGKRNPNPSGTGRWKLTAKRNKLLCVYAGKDKPPCTFQGIAEFLSAYLSIDTDFKDCTGCIDSINNCLNLDGTSYPLRFFPEKNKPGRKRKRENTTGVLDVFSVFDAFEVLTAEPYIAIVVFVSCDIGEDNDEGSFNPVIGRACGDRISCVSLKAHDSNDKELLLTTIHELLHTIGFDHCSSWSCVMNAISVEGGGNLFLSPVNLRKLKAFHCVSDSDTTFLAEKHFSRMLKCSLMESPSFSSEKHWIQQWLHHYHYIKDEISGDHD
jgi:hypothetical protein